MLISNYQYTEIVIGTLIFSLLYFIYMYYTATDIVIWDIVWCTFSVFLILSLKNFFINYNIIQSQNFILKV